MLLSLVWCVSCLGLNMFEVIYDTQDHLNLGTLRVRVIVDTRTRTEAERLALASEYNTSKWIVSSERLEPNAVIRLTERKI